MRQHLRGTDGQVGPSPALHRRNPSDLKEAIRHYSLSLAVSDRFLHHSLIRLTTLWFRLLQESATDLPAAVPELRAIAAYQWYDGGAAPLGAAAAAGAGDRRSRA